MKVTQVNPDPGPGSGCLAQLIRVIPDPLPRAASGHYVMLRWCFIGVQLVGAT
ncbi:hypothetical protein J6590_101068 [Homalodisca vitripennis]|nr:hypothetical protein J6590_101068 [Homalodisca vitripennis]